MVELQPNQSKLNYFYNHFHNSCGLKKKTDNSIWKFKKDIFETDIWKKNS